MIAADLLWAMGRASYLARRAVGLGGAPKLEAVPPRLRRLLARLLAKDPALRPDSAIEVRRELELCCASIERREALAARAALVTRRPRRGSRE